MLWVLWLALMVVLFAHVKSLGCIAGRPLRAPTCVSKAGPSDGVGGAPLSAPETWAT